MGEYDPGLSLPRPLWLDGLLPFEIADVLRRRWPGAVEAVAAARRLIPPTPREVWPEQALALAVLARAYDADGAGFLEIGTATGYSAAVLALAAPRATLWTLNPSTVEHPYAAENLRPLGERVRPLNIDSRSHWLATSEDPPLDLVFVDGDHRVAAVGYDCRWHWRLRPGGLIVFHDYSPAWSRRPTPSVIEAVDAFAAVLGRGPDVLVREDSGVALVGFLRRGDDPPLERYLAPPTPEEETP
jgi:predicted O-methyltransferase YrrM